MSVVTPQRILDFGLWILDWNAVNRKSNIQNLTCVNPLE